ncbi:MAG: class I poly(R)-hydroxyalkanoic acid synthase [Gemmobacter sp.]|nr:class I poly(R)-hydroxyalkanoic acid synthase [Gemmobacter sp.]
MTTDECEQGKPSERLTANLAKVEQLTQRMMAALSNRTSHDPALDAPDPDIFMRAASAYMAEAANNPAKIVEQQVAWWGKTLKHYVDAQHVLAKGKLSAPADPGPKDRRFSNPLWDTHPYFNFIKQQYLLNSEAVQSSVNAMDNLDPNDRKRVEYFARQIVDMMSPTNFFGTNPDALERAVATEGESLVKGLENLVRDIEANGGELLVTLADPNAFKVGQNIGATPGQVVFRNRMLELIQFSPTTEKVHKTPLVIFPPWINKFYIMDLKPQNSLIKWIVDQGYTLFVVSWVNPDASHADIGMDDYVNEGYVKAIEAVKSITGEDKVNAVGYCIAGTTLSLTLAMMAKKGDASIKSATFFTMLSDFSDQGEFAPFLTDDFIDGIEREVAEKGYLSNKIMSRTFSFLRSNDLIYQPAIRSYMMGEAPPAFDLLFWNGDGTNLPGRMAVEYLRWLCQQDQFARGTYMLNGQIVSPADIKTPLCAIACETDHIAAWKASFAGIRKFGSKDKTFILSESGHIAGIVNPPGKEKYGHYVNDDLSLSAEDWQKTATFTKGSWWPRWDEWLAKRSGPKVAARIPGSEPGYPALCPSPGTYVIRAQPV